MLGTGLIVTLVTNFIHFDPGDQFLEKGEWGSESERREGIETWVKGDREEGEVSGWGWNRGEAGIREILQTTLSRIQLDPLQIIGPHNM